MVKVTSSTVRQLITQARMSPSSLFLPLGSTCLRMVQFPLTMLNSTSIIPLMSQLIFILNKTHRTLVAPSLLSPLLVGICVFLPITLLVLTSLCVWLHLLQGYKKKDRYIASQGALINAMNVPILCSIVCVCVYI